MTDADKNPKQETQPAHSTRIDRAARRRLKAQREKNNNIWYGMGMFGLVGWSIAMPTVLGAVLGLWIDRRWQSPYSWTLMLLVAGLLVGCSTAWYWIKQTGKGD